MHKAHELLENLRPDSEDFALVMRAIKFDLGDYESAVETAQLSTDTFWRAPFPVCVFQMSSGQSVHLFLTIQDGDQLTVRGFYKNEGSGFGWAQFSFDFIVSDTKAGFFSHKGEEITDWVIANNGNLKHMMLIEAARCMEVFSCSNVIQIEHEAPKFINRKRKQKNKLPIFSYRTLHITGGDDSKDAATSGGTKSSPRLHLRRGHIRQLSDGRRVWVRSAVVGSKANGSVHKDYIVDLKNAAQTPQP